jgi:hypothetical protein
MPRDGQCLDALGDEPRCLVSRAANTITTRSRMDWTTGRRRPAHTRHLSHRHPHLLSLDHGHPGGGAEPGCFHTFDAEATFGTNGVAGGPARPAEAWIEFEVSSPRRWPKPPPGFATPARRPSSMRTRNPGADDGAACRAGRACSSASPTCRPSTRPTTARSRPARSTDTYRCRATAH